MKKILLFTLSLLLSTAAFAQQSPKEIVIGSNSIRLKQDLTRGGAICYISQSNEDRNLVNICDEGRYIQQSYYAGRSVNRQNEGQCATWSPWAWNPIQVGDYARNRAEILDFSNKGRKSYVKCIPMQWDMNNKPAEATMEQWTSIKGNVVHVRNRLVCNRTDDLYGEGVVCSQEIPAVYVISALKNLYSYFGDKPFSHQPIKSTEVKQLIMNDPEHFWGLYRDASEQWMAFVNDSGWGIAVYSPSAEAFLAGRFDSFLEGDEHHVACSYIAPIKQEALKKDSVMEYEYYLIIGTLDEMRKNIYKFNRKQR